MALRTLFFLLFVLGSVCARADEVCTVPLSRLGGEELAYQGQNHWFVSQGQSLFEIRADKLVSVINNNEQQLQLVCGKRNEVLAFSGDKVFRVENGALTRIPAEFPGILAHTDGKTFYSWIMKPINVFTVFATRDGKSRRIAKGEIGYRTTEGYFVVSDKVGYTMFQDGMAIVHGKKPNKVRGISRFVVGGLMSCHRSRDGIFRESLDQFYIVRTAQGDTSITTPGYIRLGASRQQCSEYVLLMGDNDNPERNNVLWSFIPSEGPPPKRIPTPCHVNDFSLSEDGSLHYRCGNTLYFKDASRSRDKLLGTLPSDEVVRDHWLPILGYGTLYAAILKGGSPSKRQTQACFSRLLGEKMIQIGCAPVTPEKHSGW